MQIVRVALGTSISRRLIVVFFAACISLLQGITPSARAGVILEGDSQDLSFITKVTYVEERNAFVLNDDVVYLNPVSRDDLKQLNDALAKDDKIGVSNGGDQSTMFGALSPNGNIARKLKAADRFLSAIAFGNLEYLPGYRFASGYQPKFGEGRVVVFFRFHDFRFSKGAGDELVRSSGKIDSTLVPLSTTKRGAGFLPDNDRIVHGTIDAAYVENMQHLDKNIDYYAREKAVRNVFAYGEAAAFLRSLKAKGLKLELH